MEAQSFVEQRQRDDVYRRQFQREVISQFQLSFLVYRITKHLQCIASSTSKYTVSHRIPDIFNCNSTVNRWILIIFGRNIWQDVGS